MEEESLFDGKHYITAQVIIRADEFAKEMLGENPTPQEMEEFIKDHASLMEIVYGSARLARWDLIVPDMRYFLQKILEINYDLKNSADYLVARIADADITEVKKPWYKRIFGK